MRRWSLRRVTTTPGSLRDCLERRQRRLEMHLCSLKLLAPRSHVHYYPSDSQGGSKIKRVVTIARRAVNLYMRLQNKAARARQFRLVVIMLDIKIKKAFQCVGLVWSWGVKRSQCALLKDCGAMPLPVFKSLAWTPWQVDKPQQGLSFVSLRQPTRQGITA